MVFDVVGAVVIDNVVDELTALGEEAVVKPFTRPAVPVAVVVRFPEPSVYRGDEAARVEPFIRPVTV